MRAAGCSATRSCSVSGATGTGKTLLATEFLAGSGESGERALMFAFEESRDQIFRNAVGWGVDFDADGGRGTAPDRRRPIPRSASLEDHLVEIKREIDEFRRNRVAIDSLSALERIGSDKGFREFVIGLTSYLKSEAMLAVLTAATPSLFGGDSVTEAHISTLTDTIILLRYVETAGRGAARAHRAQDARLGARQRDPRVPHRGRGARGGPTVPQPRWHPAR